MDLFLSRTEQSRAIRSLARNLGSRLCGSCLGYGLMRSVTTPDTECDRRLRRNRYAAHRSRPAVQLLSSAKAISSAYNSRFHRIVHLHKGPSAQVLSMGTTLAGLPLRYLSAAMRNAWRSYECALATCPVRLQGVTCGVLW